MQTHVLLSGAQKTNGLVGAHETDRVLSGWICPKRLKAGDRILVYYWGPVQSIVASAIAVSDARRASDGRFKTRITNVEWLPFPIHLSELRDAFPDWKWTENCSSRTTLSPDRAEALWKIARTERNEAGAEERSATTNVARFGLAENNRIVEIAAICAVTEHFTKQGYKVKSRERENVGYDLEARKGSSVRHIEVKGTSGDEQVFMLTKNEDETAHRDSAFTLAIVTQATSKSHCIHEYDSKSMKTNFDIQPITYRGSIKPSKKSR